MTRDEMKKYNEKCVGEYRLYDTGTSWGFTLMSTETGKMLEVVGAGWELWDRVDRLCGYREGEQP